MSTAVRFTVEEFDQIVESGVFSHDPDRRVELVFGEIREMVHPGPLHEQIVDLLTKWSFASVNVKKVRVRVEKTLGIPELDSVPRPDLAWVREANYSQVRPSVDDLLLLIEVSDSTFGYDTGAKLRLYAEAGVKDYWIVNARKKTIQVFREPSENGYQSEEVYAGRNEVAPLAVPSAKLIVSKLFIVG